MPCFPTIISSKLRRRSSKGSETEADFVFPYYKIERSSMAQDEKVSSVLTGDMLKDLPGRQDNFRSIYMWLETQERVSGPCACCQTAEDSHYACSDVSTRLITFIPQRPSFNADVSHARSASYLSQESRSSPRTSFGCSPPARPATATREAGHYYSNPAEESYHHSRTGSMESSEYIYLDFEKEVMGSASWQVTRKPTRKSPVRSAFV